MSPDRFIVSVQPLASPIDPERRRILLGQLLQRLRDGRRLLGLQLVGARAIGHSGSRHVFSEIYPRVKELAAATDLQWMIADPDPAIRVMGAKCIVNQPAATVSLSPLLNDQERLCVAAGGCCITVCSVAEVVEHLMATPAYLD